MKNKDAAYALAQILNYSKSNNLHKIDAIRNILVHSIRRISEGIQCWHAYNEYRTLEVCEKSKHITQKSLYHSFCNKNFRHEHIVPPGVILKLIEGENDCDEYMIYKILEKHCITATITLDEDKRLTAHGLRSNMPSDFFNPNSTLYQDPLSRYKIIGLDKELRSGFLNTALYQTANYRPTISQ